MIDLNHHLILMAEDDADDQLLVQEAFAECGTEGTAAFRGRRRGVDGLPYAARAIRRRRKLRPAPALILLDLNMPRKDGREALKEIRAHPDLRRVPVVVFTTSRADTDIRKVYELGANSFITKPAAFDALVTTVTQMVGYWFGLVELPSPKLAAPMSEPRKFRVLIVEDDEEDFMLTRDLLKDIQGARTPSSGRGRSRKA